MSPGGAFKTFTTTRCITNAAITNTNETPIATQAPSFCSHGGIDMV